MHINDSELLKTRAYVNGHWVDADSGETYPVDNPASGEVIAEVAKCGTAETKRAIDAAASALVEWRKTTAPKRAVILKRWHRLIIENLDDLAEILTTEQGKPLKEARSEIIYGASYVEWFAEEARRIYGDTIPQSSNDKRLLVVKEPVGVVACITPWNFPNAMLVRKIAPALAAGCTVVCKPANLTPLSAFAVAELAEQAGVPPGVINMISGKTSEIGEELTANPDVRKLTFTGSTPVGKMLMAQCAKTVKRTSMELGGNAPFIVFEDADIDAAIEGAMESKFRNGGQTCVCSNRFIVQESVYDEFAAKLSKAASSLVLGNGNSSTTTIGPLVSEKAANDVRGFIEDALEKGAKLLTGSGTSELGPTFVPPTVITDANNSMRVFREEIFGPVAPIFKFKNEQEAIAMANDSEFGLACYFYSRDIGRCWRVAEALEYGMVGINEGQISNAAIPFGGMKESGQGREGSKYGLDDYLEIKHLSMGGIDSTA